MLTINEDYSPLNVLATITTNEFPTSYGQQHENIIYEGRTISFTITKNKCKLQVDIVSSKLLKSIELNFRSPQLVMSQTPSISFKVSQLDGDTLKVKIQEHLKTVLDNCRN